MRKDGRRIKYKTHPVIGAILILSLLMTTATGLVAYTVSRHMSDERDTYLELRERCAYESYMSLCESIGRGDMVSAADALSRCELFCGVGELASLREAIMSGSVDKSISDALGINGADVTDTISQIAAAIKRADAAAAGSSAADKAGKKKQSAGMMHGEWETLRNKIEMSEEDAMALARECIGGGATLATAQNSGFPLVYTYTCKNAFADITRMGGRLIRMYAYRHGTADVKSERMCRAAARAFVAGTGIGDAAIVSGTANGDTFDYIFCGTFNRGGETVLCVGETVYVSVAAAGAGVCAFDATGYYRNKPMSYNAGDEMTGRAEAAEMLGCSADELEMIYTAGRLFWRQSGAGTPLIEAETGDVMAQNP